MKRIFIIVAASMLCFTERSSAQTVDIGGTNFNNDILGWTDLYNLSFTSHNYGTARSMGMANAFTALGADMISASLNPAGIGMYVSSDVSITPIMQFSKSPMQNSDAYYNNVPKHDQEFTDHTERFGMSSIGGVFTAYRGTGALTNFNIGFVYNRIADFNSNILNASIGNPYQESMANVFCTMSNVDGLTTNANGTMSFGNDPYYWGAVLAYKNGLTNKDDMGWFIDRIGQTAEIDQYSAVQTRGSIGEYAITMGFNIKDVFYFGATLGLQSVSYSRNTYYGENYIYPDGNYPPGADIPYQLVYMNYMQRTRISGSGINLKLGMTVRPTEWLRLGIAYHTPTYYSLNMRYNADMASCTYSAGNNPDGYDLDRNGNMYDYVATNIWEDAGPNGWDFRSPSRLMFGAAVTLGGRVIVSADYERSWYQSTRLQSSPIYGLSYTTLMKDVFKGSNTLRIGAEAYVLRFMALRAGYIWSGSTLNDGYKDAIFTRPIPTQQNFITAGLGFKISQSVYIDLAYQYGTTKYSPFKTFYALDSEYPEQDIESRLYSYKTNRHMGVVTLGFRF